MLVPQLQWKFTTVYYILLYYTIVYYSKLNFTTENFTTWKVSVAGNFDLQ